MKHMKLMIMINMETITLHVLSRNGEADHTCNELKKMFLSNANYVMNIP